MDGPDSSDISDETELTMDLSNLNIRDSGDADSDSWMPRSEVSSRSPSDVSSTSSQSSPGLSQNNRHSNSASALQAIIKSIDNYEEIMTRQKNQALDDKNTSCICNVWEKDLYEAFAKIRSLSAEYNFVAMDTEFPGVVCKYPSKYTYPNHYHYEEIRTNVDSMKLIQLGLTLMDKHGSTPPGICTWQFNFKFSLSSDIYAVESVKMLILAGLQFQKHETDGIDPDEFGYYFLTSGLALTNSTCDPTWITFHSGYDFAYLIRILSGQPMPEDDAKYMQRVRKFFPRVYDVKYLMLSCRELYGGLQDVATRLGVLRQGSQHQAGSDSLLTGRVYFRMRELFFGQNIDENKYNGCLFGFTTSYAEVPPIFEFWRDGSKGSNSVQV